MALVKTIFEALKCLKDSVFETSKLVSTKTLLLKHYYHYIQKISRTALYYFRIIFGNSCSAITEPNCFWNYLVLVRTVSIGLPNP